MIRLNKTQCFIAGFGILFLFYFLNRAKFIIGSEKVAGTFVFYVEDNDTTEGKQFYPIIEFKYKDSVYRFKGREGSSYKLNQKLPVLLKNKNPDKPMLFTLESFWLYPLFYMILPVIIWSAFSLSYVTKNETLEINLKYPFFRKKKSPVVSIETRNSLKK
jgi:hypothetical protein